MFSQTMVSRKGYLIFLGTGSGPSFPHHCKVRLIFLFLLFEKCYNKLSEKFVSLTSCCNWRIKSYLYVTSSSVSYLTKSILVCYAGHNFMIRRSRSVASRPNKARSARQEVDLSLASLEKQQQQLNSVVLCVQRKKKGKCPSQCGVIWSPLEVDREHLSFSPQSYALRAIKEAPQ